MPSRRQILEGAAVATLASVLPRTSGAAARTAGAGKPQSVSWNGAPHAQSWIGHADLAQGGVLTFHMGPKPNLAFGAAQADRPPSFA